MLGVAGILNVLALLVALRVFCRRLGAGDSVVVLTAGFTLVLWGVAGFGWNGFPGLTALSFSFAFPSTPAFALMVAAWTVFTRFRDSGRGLVALVVLPPVIVLVHPFTAVETLVGIVGHPGRPAVGVAAAGADRPRGGGGGRAGARLAVHGGDGAVTDAPELYRPLVEEPLARYGLALVGVPALVYGLRRPFGRELLIIAVLGAVVAGLAVASGRYEFARLIPVVGLMCHLALARHLGERLTGWRPYAVVTAVACAAGLAWTLP